MWDQLVPLEKIFMSLPAQAVSATLAGVERDIDRKALDYVTSHLLNRRLVAVPVDQTNNSNPAIVLFDSTKEGDIIVSEEMLHPCSAHPDLESRTMMYDVKVRFLVTAA